MHAAEEGREVAHTVDISAALRKCTVAGVVDLCGILARGSEEFDVCKKCLKKAKKTHAKGSECPVFLLYPLLPSSDPPVSLHVPCIPSKLVLLFHVVTRC